MGQGRHQFLPRGGRTWVSSMARPEVSLQWKAQQSEIYQAAEIQILKRLIVQNFSDPQFVGVGMNKP